MEEGFEQRFMFFETAPGCGQMEDGLSSRSAQDGTAEEDGGSQGSGLAITGLGCGRLLIEAQQVEGKEYGQEGRLGCPEVLGAEAIGGQIMPTPRCAVRWWPGRCNPAITPAVGHPDPEGVAGQVNEFAPHGRFAFPDGFAHHDEAALCGPAQKLGGELAHGVMFIHGLPVVERGRPDV